MVEFDLRRAMVGAEARRTGRLGEVIFEKLAREHWGPFQYTGDAEGTDGYLRWDDLAASRLFVQIKSTPRRPKRGPLSVYIRPHHLREWYAFRPLLVRCVTEESRAWWVDTAEFDWPFNTTTGLTFTFPEIQEVNAANKHAVQRIALRLPRRLPPGVVTVRPSPPITPFDVVPPGLCGISAGKVKGYLKEIYAEMNVASIVERDGTALAAARLIQANARTFDGIPTDDYLNVVIGRLLSCEQGGRSNTLIALASLLRPGPERLFSSDYVTSLQPALERAVTAGTYVNPEFGLIVGASLLGKFPRDNRLFDFVAYITEAGLNSPATDRNTRLHRVARVIKRYFDDRTRPHPISLSTQSWIRAKIIRPLKQDNPIFLGITDAIEAAWRIVKTTPSQASTSDLELFDGLTRFQATDMLGKLRRA
jgi:hypothetical protein